jgi:photosystem II protein
MTCRAFKPSRSTVVRPVASGGGKTDLNKVGLNSIPEGVVKNNLKGIAPAMEKKGWVDSQGRKGKVGTVWHQLRDV